MIRLIILAFIVCLQSCVQNSLPVHLGVDKYDFGYDTSVVAILKYDSTNQWRFKGKVTTVELQQNDFAIIDSLILEAVGLYNSQLDSQHLKSYGVDFSKFKYKRQYIAVINDRNEKVVWVNFLCNTHDYSWKTSELLVSDGGNCYFQLQLNLSTGKYSQVYVNGYAYRAAYNKFLAKSGRAGFAHEMKREKLKRGSAGSSKQIAWPSPSPSRWLQYSRL